MAKILFFAQLREVLQQDGVSLSVQDSISIADLRLQLQQRFPDWADLLAEGRALAALNQQLVDDAAMVQDGDEIAFFPPVTGG